MDDVLPLLLNNQNRSFIKDDMIHYWIIQNKRGQTNRHLLVYNRLFDENLNPYIYTQLLHDENVLQPIAKASCRSSSRPWNWEFVEGTPPSTSDGQVSLWTSKYMHLKSPRKAEWNKTTISNHGEHYWQSKSRDRRKNNTLFSFFNYFNHTKGMEAAPVLIASSIIAIK